MTCVNCLSFSRTAKASAFRLRSPLIMRLRFEINNEEWKITSVQHEARMVEARKELANGKA